MRRVTTIMATAVLVLSSAACAIQPDATERDIPVGDRLPLDLVDPDAGESGGSSRIYLLTSGEDDGVRHLRSVLRNVEPTPTAVLGELFKGPNQDELDFGLRTAVPEQLALNPPRQGAGTLNVDVSSEILELPASALRLAVAQIVFTASELEGVRAVRLRVDGAIRPDGWPDGGGELQDAPLSVYDFPGFAESTQPPYPAVPSAAGA